jgi:putative MATE family efflux protein
MSKKARLTRGSIARHLVEQTAPLIVGVTAMVSIGLVDAYFVGWLGATELAAMSFIFPVITALSSLGVGVMAGTSSVVSRAIGAGNEERASRCATLGILLGLTTGTVVAAMLALFHDPLFTLLQADGALLEQIGIYMLPYAFGFPLLLTISGMNGVLRAQGAAKSSLVVSISFAAANWVLDPILINGAFGIPGFGIAGAAYATIAGWIIGAGVGFWLVQRGEIPFHPTALKRGNLAQGVRDVLRVALPAAFTNSINPVGLAIMTGLLASTGEAAVGGFGVGGRLQSLAVVPLLALSGSIGAIVGQNWGAERYDRSRLAMVQAGGFCVAYGLLAAMLLYLGRGWFAGMFSEDPATIAAAMRYLEISVWGYAAYGLFIMGNGSFNAIDHASTALSLSLARVLLVMVPFALVMQPSWGADAVYTAELLANLLGAAASMSMAWYFLSHRRKDRVEVPAT